MLFCIIILFYHIIWYAMGMGMGMGMGRRAVYDTVLVCGSLLSEGSGADARFRSSGAALTERTWKGTLRKYCRERERESEKKRKRKKKERKKGTWNTVPYSFLVVDVCKYGRSEPCLRLSDCQQVLHSTPGCLTALHCTALHSVAGRACIDAGPVSAQFSTSTNTRIL